MNKKLLVGLSTAALLSMVSITAFAEDPIKTADGLLEITLPGEDWYQINSDEHTEMFSDGDCAILVNFYTNGETLPAIESADANHELIYTAAASTQEYIMHVVGYAHAKDDFSSICKSINSIKVDDTKISGAKLTHSISSDQYGVSEMNYTAWVNADELNVRSTSEDGSIIATLAYGDKVTVTGSILKNNMEIGWSRIKTADGTEGYVSAQFLSTILTADEEPEIDQDAEKTSTVVKAYDAYSNEYNLTAYSDGTFRTEDGKIFWQDRHGNYVDGGDLLLSIEKPNGGNHRNGNSMTVYDSTGAATIIYQYSDGEYYDDYFNHYTCYGGDPNNWSVNDGEWRVTLYNPVEYAAKTGNSQTLQSSYYTGRVVYEYTDGTWRDDYGNIFDLTEDGSWSCGDGELYTDTDFSIPIYSQDGTCIDMYKDHNTGELYDLYGNTYNYSSFGNLLACSDGSAWCTYPWG